MKMRSKGRPVTKPASLMNGFYIEVRNQGSKDRGVKIRSDDKEHMEATAAQYRKNNKDVTILGEHKDLEWVKKLS